MVSEIERRFVGLASATAPPAVHGSHPCQGLYWSPKNETPRVAVIATHYNVDFAEHYLAPYLAARGFGFLGWNTRYRGAEDLFILEHALIDIGAGVAFEALGATDKALETPPGAHYFEDAPPYRDEVADLIAGWIEQRA